MGLSPWIHINHQLLSNLYSLWAKNFKGNHFKQVQPFPGGKVDLELGSRSGVQWFCNNEFLKAYLVWWYLLTLINKGSHSLSLLMKNHWSFWVLLSLLWIVSVSPSVLPVFSFRHGKAKTIKTKMLQLNTYTIFVWPQDQKTLQNQINS